MGGAPVVVGTPVDCDVDPADALISEFSSDDGSAGSLAVLGLEGRPAGGSWRLALDGSAGTAAVDPVAIDPASCSSPWALRFKGAGFTGWGSIAQGLFADGAAADVSDYRGLRFSMRATAGMTVRLKVPDGNTYVTAGVCTKCDDHFGRDLAVTTEWREFQILFSELRQLGNGNPLPAAFDPRTMYGVEFLVYPGQTFELYIDDVALLP